MGCPRQPVHPYCVCVSGVLQTRAPTDQPPACGAVARFRRLALAGVVALLLASCGAGATTAGGSTSATSTQSSATTTSADSTSAPSVDNGQLGAGSSTSGGSGGTGHHSTPHRANEAVVIVGGPTVDGDYPEYWGNLYLTVRLQCAVFTNEAATYPQRVESVSVSRPVVLRRDCTPASGNTGHPPCTAGSRSAGGWRWRLPDRHLVARRRQHSPQLCRGKLLGAQCDLS